MIRSLFSVDPVLQIQRWNLYLKLNNGLCMFWARLHPFGRACTLWGMSAPVLTRVWRSACYTIARSWSSGLNVEEQVLFWVITPVVAVDHFIDLGKHTLSYS